MAARSRLDVGYPRTMGTGASKTLSTAALGSGAFELLVGVFVPVVAAVQGSNGGATAFLGLMTMGLLGCVTLLLGVVTLFLSPSPQEKRRALGALGLGVGACVVFLALVRALVPASAFRM